MSVFPRPAGNSVGRSEGTVPSRTEFPSFPYDKPYEIQLQLMRAVYAAVEHGQVGIMESPTGTGKTLSLICSVLQWLLDEHERQAQSAAGNQAEQPPSAGKGCEDGSNSGDREDRGDCKASEDCEPDWLRDYEGVKEREAAARVCAQRQQRLEHRRREREAASADVLGPGGIRWQHVQVQGSGEDSQGRWGRRSFGGAIANGDLMNGRGVVGKGSGRKEGDMEPEQGIGGCGREEEEEEEQFLVPEWESDDDDGGGAAAAAGRTGHGRKKRARGKGASGASDSSSDEESGGGAAAAAARMAGTRAAEALAEESLKVFFCSRTHSQLSQFITELRRTPFADQLFTVSLASRKNLCINQCTCAVLKLGNASAISERCLELQRLAAERKSKTSKQGERDQASKGRTRTSPSASASASACGCPYWGKAQRQQQFLQHLVAAPPADIEDLGRLGSRHKLGAGNRRYVLQLQVVARGIGAVIASAKQPRMQGIDEFLFSLAVDNINLFKLHHYVQASNIAHKVMGVQSMMSSGFDPFREDKGTVRGRGGGREGEWRERGGGGQGRARRACELLVSARAIILAGGTLQPLDTMLDQLFPSLPPVSSVHPFSPPLPISPQLLLLVSAQAIILAGGTLQPLDTMLDQLFPSLPPARLRLFSCGHIVPGESVLPLAVAKGPSGKNLDFTFQSRSDPAMQVPGPGRHGEVRAIRRIREAQMGHAEGEELGSGGFRVDVAGTIPHLPLHLSPHPPPLQIAELGRLLVNVCSVAPGGIVVFFPSFAYLQEVLSAWQAGAAGGAVLPMLEARKGGVFIEPRGAAEVEAVLGQYRRCIQERGVQEKGGGQGRGVQGKDSQESGQGGVGTSGGDLQAANRVSPRGAVLLCVMGGKMSEGINFSDDMGRAVVVVGQPFPSPSDLELNERIRFIDRLAGSSSRSVGPGDAGDDGAAAAGVDGGAAAAGVSGGAIGNSTSGAGTRPSDTGSQDRTASLGDSSVGEGAVALAAAMRSCGSKGRQLYEDICAKAVNQSIGRAIRHRGDYAAILLVDARYAHADGKGIAGKLPSWIKAQLVVCNGSFGEVPRRLRQFFRHNEEFGKGK
ncbi:unnamed protein product [Closterium sp. NIES-65]|nr:unnamed protein product [Closterium sp. NIES-65]